MGNILYSKGFKISAEKPGANLYESLYELKRDLILFDQIVFPDVDLFCQRIGHRLGKIYPFEVQVVIKELQILKDKQLIRDFKLNQDHQKSTKIFGGMLNSLNPNEKFMTETFARMLNEHVRAIHKLESTNSSYLKEWGDKELERIYWDMISTIQMLESILVTKLISWAEGLEIIDSKPVRTIQVNSFLTESVRIDKHNTYCFILNDLPLPSDSTPWQEIIDFKCNQNNMVRLSRMQAWVRKILKEEYSENELKQEYEHLYLEFESSMRHHKIKNEKTSLKMFMVSLPGLAEDVIKMRLRKISETIYNSIFTGSIELVQLNESEINSPGKDLAYNFFSKKRFGS